MKLRETVVCNNCRINCKGNCSEVLRNPNHPEYIDLVGRKHLINCLGKYCDEPCDLQLEETDITMEILIEKVLYLGNKLNEFLIK